MRKKIAKILEKVGLYLPLVKIWNRILHHKMAKAVREYGLDTLTSMDEAFTEMNAQMFLVYGTLLGAYRNHDFIPYDFDLDVGVMDGTLPSNYQEIILKHGFRFIRQDYVKDNGWVIVETYEKNGVGIDIYYTHTNDEGTFEIYCPRKHEFKEWRSANETDGFPVECQFVDQCEFIRQDFLGRQFYMPSKITDWLKDMYTETYMTPIKNFDETTSPCRKEFPVKFRSYRNYELNK